MTSKKNPAQTAVSQPPSGAARVQQLRDWIVKAEGDGASKSDLLLRLSFRDAANLKRHPSVQADEICFSDGGMFFLGVKVAEGGADSNLQIGLV